MRQRWCRLDEIGVVRDACWVALSAVQSPGNLGSLLRTADAVGATGLVAIGPDVDPFDPAVVRATMGSIFGRRFARASLEDFARFARRAGCAIVAATPHATRDYRAVSYRRPVALLLGSERRGLTDQEERAADIAVRIPMAGRTDSLNLAVAASVLLYEVYSQRHPVRARCLS